MKQLVPYIRQYLGSLLAAIGLKGLAGFADLLIPYIMGIIINIGIGKRDIPMIIKLCIVMLVLAILAKELNIFANYLSAKCTQSIGDKLRKVLYSHIQTMKINDVENITTASLITRVTNDVEHVQRVLLMMTRFMVRAPIMAIGGTVLSLLIDPWLTSLMFIAMILLAAASFLVYKVTRKLYPKVQKNIDKMTNVLRENLEGVRVIKAFNKTAYELGRFDKQSKNVRKFEVKAGTINAFMGPTMPLISSITTAAILYVSGFRIESHSIQIGDVVTILNYINMTLMAMTMIPRMLMMFSRAKTSANRICEVLNIVETTKYGDKKCPKNDSTILEFVEVTFTYPDSKNAALKNISFKLKRGETLAIIGGTGSGKTTILNLILRLYEPTSGKILFEGRNINEYDKQTLTKKITAAMQQYNIFGMSISDNITLDLDYDDDRLSQSANSAQLDDVVDELDDKYDYIITQNGSNLSGGQKQRLSIARTLYRKSDLVVLDDVSSALDYKTDLKLRSALYENYKSTTVVLISQRISTVKTADRILVLNKGLQMGLDSHEKLLSNCQTYQKICATQSIDASEIKEVL